MVIAVAWYWKYNDMIFIVAVIHLISTAIFRNKSSWKYAKNFVLLEMLS